MEFAENNRISHRQLYRQLVLEFTAPFLLCLFGKGKIMGLRGCLGVGAAVAVLLFYVVFLIRLAPFCADLKKSAGAFAGRLTGLFFLSYVIFTAAFLLSLLAEIVPISLVAGVRGEWISFFAILTCGMGVHRGMQRRGRIAEVSGGIFLWAVLLLMVLCIWQGKWTYLKEMLADSRFTGREAAEGTYGFLCAFSGIGLLPFSMEHVEKQGSAGKTVALGLLTLGGILIGMEVLLPSVLGWDRIFQEAYPVLPLLAGADLPGNVLSRFDVLWMGFLLYSLLFAVGSLLHYGHQVVRSARLGSGRIWMAAAVYLLSVLEIRGMGIAEYFGLYLAYVFVPGMLVLQVFLMLRNRGKRKKKVAATGVASAVLCFSLFLGGCAAVEPEKRMFPLALGVDGAAEIPGGFTLIYGMPDLPQATGQEKGGEDTGNEALAISGAAFGEIEDIYDRTQEKYLDMGHLQVLVLGEDIRRDNRWEAVLDYLEQEPYVGEDVYVFQTAQAEKVLNWQSPQAASIGEYLQGLMENRTPGQEKKGVTLRELYHSRYSDGTLPALPEIRVKEKEIEVFF